MSDIIKRLRHFEAWKLTTPTECANEIEALRAKIEELKSALYEYSKVLNPNGVAHVATTYADRAIGD